MKPILKLLLLAILIKFAIAGCHKDLDCGPEEYCKTETGNCEPRVIPVLKRLQRKVEMCLHDGQCPARFRCVVFFCVYVGPDEIPQRHEDPAILVSEALRNATSKAHFSRITDFQYLENLEIMSRSKVPPSSDHDSEHSTASVFTDSSSDSIATSTVKNEGLFSRKVFIGGLPFDVNENDLQIAFGGFGALYVDWPRRQDLVKGRLDDHERQSNGYVFLIFQSEEAIDKLINCCFVNNGRYFLEMTTRTSTKSVQVRPWRKSDSFYITGDFNDPMPKINPHYSVFIGGVPRPTRAIDLVSALEGAYGKVTYASIDTDPELHYPKGAARVVFEEFVNFKAAMKGRHIVINHCGVKKRIDLKPYIIDEQCCDACVGINCDDRSASYFCVHCLMYLCERCWDIVHPVEVSAVKNPHLPFVRCGDATKQLTYVPHHVNRPVSDISSPVHPSSTPMYYSKMIYPSTFGNPCRIQV